MSAKILIVDDEPSARLTLKNLLRPEGYVLQFANDGAEGLAEARAWQPDVILSDVMMPVMDGFEFCRQIRADANLGQVPIILTTALNDRQAKVRGLEAGADDFITKPIDTLELRARLRTLTKLDRFRKLSEEQNKLERTHHALLLAHEALSASEERFRSFIEQSNDGFMLTDEQGIIIEWNPALTRITGLDRNQVLGKTMWDTQVQVTASEQPTAIDRERLKQILSEILQTGHSSWFGQPNDAKIRTVDGNIKFLQQTSFPIRTVQGYRLGAVVRDVTDHKRMEQELEAETLRRRILFDESPDGILVIDPQTAGFIEFNTTAHEQLGYSREEFAQLHIFDIEAQETANETRVHIGEVIKNGRSDFETLQRTKQGEIRNVHVTAQIVEILGQPVYYCTWRDITERKRAEEELRVSEARFATMFHSNPSAIALSRLSDNKLIDVNNAWEQTTGWSKAESVGKTPIELGIWADPSERNRMKALVAQQGTARGFEMHLRCRSGSILNLLMSAELVTLDGEACMLSMTQDITERKQVEEKLRESEERYRTTLDSMMEGCQIISPEWRYLYVNASVAEQGNSTPEELLGHTMMEVYPGIENTEMFAALRDCMENRVTRRMENEFIYQDGSHGWFNLSITPAQEGIFILSEDVTEHKQAEVKLRESEERFRAIFEQVAVGVAQIKSETGQFVRINQAYCNIVGYTNEEMLCANFQSITHPDDLQNDLDNMRLLLAGAIRTFTMEKRYYHKDGSIVWVNLTVSPMWHVGAEPDYHIAVVEDITERKRVEEKLRESEARFRSLFESSNAIMMLIEPDSGKILDANYTAAQFYGYSREQLVSMNIADINQLSPEQVAEEQQRAKREERNYFIFPDRLANGQIRTVEVRSHPITSDSQVLLFSIIYDITESVQNQKKLHESQFRTEMALKGANAATWDWNIQTGETVFNDRWAEIVGYTLQELEPISIQTWGNLCHPDDLKVSGIALEKHFAGQTEYYECEVRMKHKNGSWVWVLDHGKVMEWDANGKPIRMFGTHLDITERKREERYNQARLHLANLSYETMDMETLMRTMLDEAEALTYSTISFFHFVDGDQNTINLQTWSTNTLNTLCTAEGKGQHYPVAQAGVWADAVRDGKPRIYNDYLGLADRKGLPEGHAPVTRLISLPIKRNNKIVAAIGVGNKPHDYDEHDLDALQRLAEEAFDLVLRKRAEQALRASEEKYRGLMESLDNTIATIDHDGKFLYLNDKAAEQLGGTVEQMIGKTMHELFPPHIASRQLASIRQVLDTDQAYVHEEMTSVQGQPRWFRTSIQPIHDENGRAAFVLINSTDIHDLKTAQQKLQELNQTLEERVKERTAQVQDLYDNAPVGYHSLDSEGRFSAINQTELNWLGYEREELLGKPIASLYTLSSVETFRQLFPVFKLKGKTNELELEVVRKDGTIFPIMINAIAIYNENGEYVSSRSTMTDITERKKAEQALRESETRYRSIFENSLNGILIADPVSGKIIDANPAACQMWGGRKEELCGVERPEWVDMNDPRLALALEERNRTGKFSGEQNYRHKDGSIYPVEVSSSISTTPTGEQIANIFFTDITIRKKAEETLRQANAELERALRIKDEFLASMSHELRTPLNAILGLSEGLRDQLLGSLSEKQIKAIGSIESSGQHLLALINDILDLSKIEAGALTLNLSDVDAKALCNASLLFVREAAHKKNIKLLSTIDPDVQVISLDERRAKQMLVNLLSNAVKFTLEGGRMGLEMQGDRQMNLVRFTVWDTGIGISTEGITRLFKPFVQLDSSLSRRYEGTGLGLSLVARMAAMHGGSVTVESELGKGSRFTIALPWLEPTQVEPPIPSVASTTGSEEKPTVVAKADAPLILIAEDNEMTIFTLSMYLEPHGYRLAIANNGNAAIKMTHTHHPLLILMDLQMPDLDGLETTRRLRNDPDPQIAKVPIIALTALAMPGDRERAIAAGANEYMSKPVNLKELVKLIEQLSNARQT